MENVANLVASKLKNVEPMNPSVNLKDASDTCYIAKEKFTENHKSIVNIIAFQKIEAVLRIVLRAILIIRIRI